MPLTKEDMAELGKLISTQVAEAVKPLAERIGQQPQPQQTPPAAAPAGASTATAGATAPKPLTMDDLVKTLDARDQQRASADQRSSFQRDKLKDLPSVYQQQLGTDPAKFGENEQAIRAAYQADLKARGFTPPNVGGDPAADGSPQGGSSPANGVDLSKLSAPEQIAVGLRTSQPGRSQSFGARLGNVITTITGTARVGPAAAQGGGGAAAASPTATTAGT